MSTPGTDAINRFLQNEIRLNTFMNQTGVYVTDAGLNVKTLPQLNIDIPNGLFATQITSPGAKFTGTTVNAGVNTVQIDASGGGRIVATGSAPSSLGVFSLQLYSSDLSLHKEVAQLNSNSLLLKPTMSLAMGTNGAAGIVSENTNGTYFKTAGGTAYDYGFLAPNGSTWTMYNVKGTSNWGFGGTVTSAGNMYAPDFIKSSDIRLKCDIQVIENAIDKIGKIDGITYKWNDLSENPDKETSQSGVSAQAVLSVFPEAVKDQGNYLGVSYDSLVPLLLQAVKELSAKVDALTTKKAL